MDVILEFVEDELVNVLFDLGDGVFRGVLIDDGYCGNCDCGLGGKYIGDI